MAAVTLSAKDLYRINVANGMWRSSHSV